MYDKNKLALMKMALLMNFPETLWKSFGNDGLNYNVITFVALIWNNPRNKDRFKKHDFDYCDICQFNPLSLSGFARCQKTTVGVVDKLYSSRKVQSKSWINTWWKLLCYNGVGETYKRG